MHQHKRATRKILDPREEFCQQLEAAFQSTKSKDFLVIAADINAKIESNTTEFPKKMGKFGKGLINSSGRLLEVGR